MEGRRAGARGAGGWEAAQTAAGARRWHYEDKGTEITGILGWPLPLGLPTHGMGVASLVPPSESLVSSSHSNHSSPWEEQVRIWERPRVCPISTWEGDTRSW